MFCCLMDHTDTVLKIDSNVLGGETPSKTASQPKRFESSTCLSAIMVLQLTFLFPARSWHCLQTCYSALGWLPLQLTKNKRLVWIMVISVSALLCHGCIKVPTSAPPPSWMDRLASTFYIFSFFSIGFHTTGVPSPPWCYISSDLCKVNLMYTFLWNKYTKLKGE